MIKKITLKPNQVLTYNDIYRILNEARISFQYAKFTTYNGKYWISVNFNRDLSVVITTNSRDLGLYYESLAAMRTKTMQVISQFLFRWLPKLNRLTY